MSRNNSFFSRNAKLSRRGRFESLEPRLALAVDFGAAGVFESLGGATSSMYNSTHDLLYGGGLVMDTAGNRYVTINGVDDHVVDLDPGPAVDSKTMNSGVVKLDPSGTPLWNATFDTSGSPIRVNHAVDANQNVYLVGDFRGTVDIDPGPGVMNFTSSQAGAEYSVYFAKLNNAGQLQWARNIDGAGLMPDRLVVDSEGNLVVVANYSPGAGAMDVDAGPNQVLVQRIGGFENNNLLALKYDTNGNFVWVRQLGSTSGSLSGLKSVAVDSAGDILISGGFTGSLDLNPGAGIHTVSNPTGTAPDAYIVRLDAAGNFKWAYATEGDGSAAFIDIDIAGDGSIVASGYLKNTVDFLPGAGSLTLTATGTYASGIAVKLNSDSTVAWARSFGGLGETLAAEVAVAADGNIYLGGSFSRLGGPGIIYDFDPGPEVYGLTSPSGGETAYVLSLDGEGDFRWAVPLGGNSGRAQVQGLGVSAEGNVQVSGAFKNNGDFDPDPVDQYLLTSGNAQSVFIATLTQAVPDTGAPTVDAGLPQTIFINGVANLDGTVTDDGLPGPVTTTWTVVGGPGTVTFGDPSDIDTTATFSKVGTYSLLLTATDGQFTTSDLVQIVVNPLTTSLTATADTYIDTGKATTNFGSATSLTSDGKPDLSTLLRFNTSSIPAGSTLQSASITVNVTNASASTYEIYELKRNWTESQATWKKANSSTNWHSAGAQGSLDRGTTVLGTVTASTTGLRTITLNAAGLAVVQGWVNNPSTNFGFIIQDYANGTDDDLIISSREASIAANRPQLLVSYDPSSVPMSLGDLGAAATLDLATPTSQKSPPIKKQSIAPAKDQAFAETTNATYSSASYSSNIVSLTDDTNGDDGATALAFDLALESTFAVAL
jgi:hypothetical protein